MSAGIEAWDAMFEDHDASGRVLFVDDHPPTASLMVTAIENIAPDIEYSEVRTAEEALSLLRSIHAPDGERLLVLLDLDLPNMHGLDALEVLDANPDLRDIPVVVVSGDSSPTTVERCYECRAQGFIEKPDDWSECSKIAEAIVHDWFVTGDPSTPSRHSHPVHGAKVTIE